MKDNKKTLTYISAAFLLLCGVSLYRQISIRYFPNDVFRPFILYAMYIFLIGSWAYSLHGRITQKNMLNCLLMEVIVLSFWMTIRLLQDSLFYKDMHIMRVSGYFIAFPLVLVTLLGLYASFGLGMGEDYRIPRKYFLLLIPDTFLIALMLTNEQHHLVFKVFDNEPENLQFHTNIGIILILLWATAMIVFRIFIIYKKTKKIQEKAYIKALPLMFGIAMPIIVIPYFLNDFVAGKELIELTAKLYFLEAMSWESCIVLGMVPVNTQYSMVFEQSTVGMQIIADDGTVIASSKYADKLDMNTLSKLMEKGIISDQSGQELHLHHIHGGYLVYQKDVSHIISIINELNDAKEELENEGFLLKEEMRIKSEKAQVQAKNQIYDRLSDEIGDELDYIRRFIQNSEKKDNETIFRQLCIIGTYIKRRCNLRLIEQETGILHMEDLKFSLQDLVICFNQAGITSTLEWYPEITYSAEFSLNILDTTEKILHKTNFYPDNLDFYAGLDFRIYVKKDNIDLSDLINERNCFVRRIQNNGAFEIVLKESEKRYDT